MVRGAAGVVLTIAAVIGGIVYGTALLGDDESPNEPGADAAADPVAGGDPQPTVVLATFDETAPSAGASQVIVLSADRAEGTGTVLLIPSGTVADVPGHGALPIGRAYGFGQAPLLDAALDNLLGVDFDRVIGVSRQDWSALFTRLGGLTLEVPERLETVEEDGTRRVRFRPGEQFLDGPRVAEYLTFRAAAETELDALSRVQQVVQTMLAAIAADPDGALDPVFTDGAPMLDTAEPEAVRGLLEELGRLQREGAVVTRTLPVTPLSSGEERTYRADEERVTDLVEERFDKSVPAAAGGPGRSLEILNGNGTPGIGQDVAERLVPEGFRVVLTGNADRFDHARTRIVIYEDTDEQIRVAEEIRSLLGVGEVELSLAPQSVVDVTIVVGRDFPPDR